MGGETHQNRKDHQGVVHLSGNRPFRRQTARFFLGLGVLRGEPVASKHSHRQGLWKTRSGAASGPSFSSRRFNLPFLHASGRTTFWKPRAHAPTGSLAQGSGAASGVATKSWLACANAALQNRGIEAGPQASGLQDSNAGTDAVAIALFRVAVSAAPQSMRAQKMATNIAATAARFKTFMTCSFACYAAQHAKPKPCASEGCSSGSQSVLWISVWC
jgi:hypothetical protein